MEALKAHGWGLLLTPDTIVRGRRALPPGYKYAIDNGAWGCHQRGVAFDGARFGELVALHADGAEWVVVPDIVAGGLESLAFSLSWLPRLQGLPLLLAVQDGMSTDDVEPYLGAGVGVFLGGTTEWKLATMRQWGHLARRVGCHYHVARVNTARRIALCQDAGAHSFDGTSASRFAVTTPRLTAAMRQGHLFGGLNE
jgi:hypothetical protein